MHVRVFHSGLALACAALLSSGSAWSQSPGNNLINLHFTAPAETPKKFLFLPVRFPDQQQVPVTEAELNALAAQVDFALDINSYGELHTTHAIAKDGANWIEMPHPTTYYLGPDVREFLAKLRADALQATIDAGYPAAALATFDREIIFAKNFWSATTGYASNIGGINYRTMLMSGDDDVVFLHELGHTLGWQHANFLAPRDNPNGGGLYPAWAIAGNEIVNYGDPFDMMGEGLDNKNPCGNQWTLHHFHPWFKRRAGWLPASSVEKVTADDLEVHELPVTQAGSPVYTIVSLQPIGADPGPHPSAIRIPKTGNTEYWLFWRAYEPGPIAISDPYGNCPTAGAPNYASQVDDGVIVSFGFKNPQARTLMLDVNPDSQADPEASDCGQGATNCDCTPCNPRLDALDSRLKAGDWYEDLQAGFRVTHLGGDSAAVQLLIEPAGTPPTSFGLVDRLPKIDVLAPARGETITGMTTVQVTAVDPDPGESISRVQMWIVDPGCDPCTSPTAGYPPTPPPVDCGVNCPDGGVFDSNLDVPFNVNSGAYEWDIDPANLPVDAHVTLVVRAESTNPAADTDNIYWFLMVVDD